MPDLSQTCIKTERLWLVPAAQKFAKDIFREFTDEITRYMIPSPNENIDQAKYFVSLCEKANKMGSDFETAIILPSEASSESADPLEHKGEFIGCAGAHNLGSTTPELGIWIKKDAQGHKYGREAIHALYNWVISNYSCQYVKYPVEMNNIPSRLIAESLGGIICDIKPVTAENGRQLTACDYHIFPKR